jgi:hypothetical protein
MSTTGTSATFNDELSDAVAGLVWGETRDEIENVRDIE